MELPSPMTSYQHSTIQANGTPFSNDVILMTSKGRGKGAKVETDQPKLQALVYDILPSTTAVFSYAIGSRKLSANEQFFVGTQTVVSLLQTTQIISHICFITEHVAYASSNITKTV